MRKKDSEQKQFLTINIPMFITAIPYLPFVPFNGILFNSSCNEQGKFDFWLTDLTIYQINIKSGRWGWVLLEAQCTSQLELFTFANS